MKLGGIEAGGTKFVCGISDENGNILDRKSFPTTDPQNTVPTAIEYFKGHEISSLGVGCFGPIDMHMDSPTYGYITTTPKIKWQNYNILGTIKKEFNIPIGFDTDVNGAVLGEAVWGAAKDIDSCLYLTVGTGIGGGLFINHQLVHGLLHPEMGHILVNKHEKDMYKGTCPFHHNCLESLASGPSIENRWGKSGDQLPEDHICWDMESYYLAQAIVNFILIASPQKIILGGGVMKQSHLFPKIRAKVIDLLNGYIKVPQIQENIENYIVYPDLGDNAGLLGAIALGYNLLHKGMK